MINTTPLSKSTPEEIQAVIFKFCTWYAQQKRISPDFEKNKAALMRWFQNERPSESMKPLGKLYGVKDKINKESKTDQLRKTGLYE